MLKSAQYHPVRGETMHVDLLRVNLDVAIHAVVPLELVGGDESPGVKDGGVLEHITRELNIEALPTEIPEALTFDASAMQINDTITLADVPVPVEHHAARRSRRDRRRDAVAAARRHRGRRDRVRDRGRRRGRRRTAPATPPATPTPTEPTAVRLPGRGMTAPVDWLVVGLGNPGSRYAGTRHNIGFEVANALAQRWQLPKAKTKFNGLLTEGRTGPGGPRVAVLLPQTYMNEAGRSVGPARGAFKVPLERVLVVHDEIDVPFGDVRTRVGGGLAGHNGLKSLKAELGGADFARVRIGVGRPDSTDPEIVSAHVLGAFAEPKADVADLVDRATDAAEAIVLGEREL